jgi:Domain of unknown function (DUF4159)
VREPVRPADRRRGCALSRLRKADRRQLQPTVGDDIGFAFATGVKKSPGSPARSRRKSVLWPAIIVTAVVGIIGSVATIVMVHHDLPAAAPAEVAVPWDRAHREELEFMRSDAQQLAATGQLQSSLDEYNKLLATIGNHDISDPITTQVAASARTEQGVVFAALMDTRKTPPAPVASAVIPLPPPVLVNQFVPPPLPITPATEPAVLSVATPTTQAAPTPTTNPTIAAADNAPPMTNAPPAVSLHAYTLRDGVTDQQIGDAIAKGVAYLRSQFDQNGQVIAIDGEMPDLGGTGPRGGGNGPSDRRPGNRGNDGPPNRRGPPGGFGGNFAGREGTIAGAYSTPGFDALCVYALLQSGQALEPKILDAHDKFAQLILDRLKQYNLAYTYHRSLRAAALAVLTRPMDTAVLEEDVRWLISANREGGYTYIMPQSQSLASTWDNSNSQYGLLGVWSGAQAGLGVPINYWHQVDNHWSGCVIGGGTWSYFANSAATLSMTFAGIASELVSRDYLNAPNGPADAGLAWLDQGDNCTSEVSTSMSPAYTLYGLERVGLASGYKYFGAHDWYSEFAQKLINQQHADGSWGSGGNDSLVDTSYYLLFLARGRHPILFNKLRYEGNWDAHSRDVMHLSRYASKQLERPLNWQVVNLRHNWFEWLDAPVLYISGTTAPDFSEQDYNALRTYVEGGGLIFTQADDDSPAFTKWVAFAAHKMFPRYEMMTVPADHPLYSVNYKFKKPPPLTAISNGSRLLLVHSPTDIAKGWQLDWTDTYINDFHLGLNLFVYAAGKSVNLKHRLASTYIPAPPEAAATTRTLTCLRYSGAWNPEPYALTRFARYFQWETHTGLNVSIVDLKSLQPNLTPIAVLTGTVRNDFTDAEEIAARQFVAAGGVLVIDACGGQTAFAKSVESTLIAPAFPGAVLAPLPDDYPGLIASRPGADDLGKAMYRSYAIEQVGRVPLLGFTYGQGRVLYSRLDLTTGLLGTQSWGILGFDPAYSQALMKNLILWSAARAGV